ncbi:MAG: SDR family NAD(P)-dependent oxidoreductase [Pseudomonadota bacterium]|nr:SDR family NAD(P)-dependent oxidoreductase [Pseudomonadota bacterium]
MTDTKTAAAIFGVGPRDGVGAELCHQAARAGHHVFVNGRTAEKIEAVADAIRADGGSAEPLLADVTNVEQVNTAMETVAKSGLPLELVVYNAGNNRPEAFLDVTPEIYEEMWRVICFGAFVVSQATIRLMLTQQDIAERQSLFFTGASGSLRGKANFSAFASGKGAMRMLAQSIAREFGPQNIHVAHVVIDGAINGEKISTRFPEFLERLGEDGTLNIGAIAEAFMMLHGQHKTAWTQELDLRPFKENF